MGQPATVPAGTPRLHAGDRPGEVAPGHPPQTTAAWPDEPAGTVARVRGWRWWVGRLGRVLIALGVLVLLFAAYQLWGTGIQEARAQDRLSRQFDKAMAATTSATAAPTTVASTVPGVPTTVATTAPAAPTSTSPAATAPPPPAEGEGLARLEIPKIGVDKIVVEGVGVEDLRKGPGHYPGTALPGVRGNTAIAGHRTTYGAPFEDIDRLKPGNEIVLTTVTGRYVYRVTGTRIVSPAETSVLADSPDPILTLTSCHPKYSASQRIIVSAAFDPSVSSPLLEKSVAEVATTLPVPTTAPAPATTLPGEEPSTVATTAPPAVVATTALAAGTFNAGWVSDSGAWLHVLFWGAILVLIGLAAWRAGKRIPMWAATLAATVPFLVVLYFFFENVNRLLPPNL